MRNTFGVWSVVLRKRANGICERMNSCDRRIPKSESCEVAADKLRFAIGIRILPGRSSARHRGNKALRHELQGSRCK